MEWHHNSNTICSGVRTMGSARLTLDAHKPRLVPTQRQMPRSYPNSHVTFTTGLNSSTDHTGKEPAHFWPSCHDSGH